MKSNVTRVFQLLPGVLLFAGVASPARSQTT